MQKKRSSFATGVGLLFGGSIAFYIVRFVLPYYVTSTSFSDNMMTYLVPLGILIAVIIAIFFAFFKRRD